MKNRFQRGEIVCGGCGLILVQNIADTSYENTHDPINVEMCVGVSAKYNSPGCKITRGNDLNI